MKGFGGTKKILGMEIHKDCKAGTLYPSQKGYIDVVLERFGIQGLKPVSTPLAAHAKLSAVLSSQTEGEGEHITCSLH